MLPRIVYSKTNGIAHDIRFAAPDYILQPGESEIAGDVLPTQASLSDPQLPAPDVAGFIQEAKGAFGGIVAASEILGAQATFLALQAGNFADAQALIVDSHATNALSGGLTDQQYAGIKALIAKYHLPIVLP